MQCKEGFQKYGFHLFLSIASAKKITQIIANLFLHFLVLNYTQKSPLSLTPNPFLCIQTATLLSTSALQKCEGMACISESFLTLLRNLRRQYIPYSCLLIKTQAPAASLCCKFLKSARSIVFIIYRCITNHPPNFFFNVALNNNSLLYCTSLCVSWIPLLIWPGFISAGLLYVSILSWQFDEGNRGDWSTMCHHLAGHPRLACMVAASFKERTWKCACLSEPRLRIDTFPLLVKANSKANQIQREVKEPPSQWEMPQSYTEKGPGNQEGNNCTNFANQTGLLHVIEKRTDWL